MKYDFDTIIDRRNTNSLKWDLIDCKLPMWVADMDFPVAEEIKNSLIKRVNHPVYAYSIVPDDLYTAYVNWWDRRHNFKMKKEDLLFCIGVMPAISSIIRQFTSENDNIVIQTPVYHIFFKVIEINNRVVFENKLDYDGVKYTINFDDLEEKLSNSKTSMMILCNPHNPIGKIWSKEDLKKIVDLCDKYNVLLVSDEIHCDLTDPDKYYTPTETVADNTDNIITCLSPTKTFNIAGIQSSIIHVSNNDLYSKLKDRLVIDDSAQINVFAIDATITAFNECEDWLNQLNKYVYQNKQFVSSFIDEKIPSIKLVKSDATYLLWLDCSNLKMKSKELSQYLNEKYGLFLSPGKQFGDNGDEFLRLNIACPRELLKKGLESLKVAVNNLE